MLRLCCSLATGLAISAEYDGVSPCWCCAVSLLQGCSRFYRLVERRGLGRWCCVVLGGGACVCRDRVWKHQRSQEGRRSWRAFVCKRVFTCSWSDSSYIPGAKTTGESRAYRFESCYEDPRFGGGGAVLYVRSRGCGGGHEVRTWRDVIESIRIGQGR
jgi:hypothetical protein